MLLNVPCEKIEENFSVSVLVIVIIFLGSNTMTEKVVLGKNKQTGGAEQHRCFCLPEEGLFLIRHSITTKSLQCLWALMPQSRHLYPCLMSPHNYITENAERCSNSASRIYTF